MKLCDYKYSCTESLDIGTKVVKYDMLEIVVDMILNSATKNPLVSKRLKLRRQFVNHY